VYRFFRKRLVQKRLVALAAAYAIALSGLIANFTGAQMAIAAAAQPAGIICHTNFASEPAPSSPSSDSGKTDSKACLGDCCIGCLMLSAALLEPPEAASAPPPSAGARIALAPATFVILSRHTKSHRSRAPPQNA
jgi:hypothetical protein